MPELRTRGSDYAHAALILGAFALLATQNLVHYPVALMALLGLWRMRGGRAAFADRPARVLLVLFALIWLPMAIALPDAVEPGRSLKTVGLYLHFLPAAYYLLRACARPAVHRMVTQGVVVLILFAGFDAFAQLIWHADLFGYPYDGRALEGVFYPKQRLGLFLAVFAPLCLEVVRIWCRQFPRLWLLHVPPAIVILMSLKRSAWLMLGAAIAGYLALVRARGGRRYLPRAWQVALMLAIVGGAVAVNPALRAQFASSAGLFSGDAAEFDQASAYRLTLWRTGLSMLEANWINGVGPRGYRFVYADYAAPDDFWIERSGTGQTHPHLLVLEVAVESGLIGLAGLIGFYLVLAVTLYRARQLPSAPVWLLCAAVAWFPLNAHLAFYGSYWSTLVWLLLGVGLAPVPPGVPPPGVLAPPLPREEDGEPGAGAAASGDGAGARAAP